MTNVAINEETNAKNNIETNGTRISNNLYNHKLWLM